MGWLDSIESVAGSAVNGFVDGSKYLAQGGEKALGDAWKGAVDAAKSVAGSAIDVTKDVASGISKGASDLSAGMRQGDFAGGLLAAGADVLHGEAAGVGRLWNGAINGASGLLGGINQGVHDIGAAAQNGYEAGVNDVAAGVGKVAGPGAASAFRSAATVAEEPFKQLAQFQWGVTEGVVEGLGGAVKGVGNLVGGAYQFATDSHFRDGVINAVENGATYVAEHPLDAAAKAGSAIKNLATDVYQGGVEAAQKGDLAEYIGKGVGQVGLVVATAVVAPEAEVGEAAGLTADGAGALTNLSRGAEALGGVSRGTEIADATANAGSVAARDTFGAITRGGEDLPAETVARGEPYAFGTGARSDRAAAIIDRSAQALGRNNASGLVDNVVYDPAARSPSFWVNPTTGERTITMDAATFGKTEAGQLIAGTHELVHAEQWEQVLGQNAGNLAAAHSQMFVPSRSLSYAIREVQTERRALQRVDNLLGGVAPQQVGHSTRYIEGWQNRVMRLSGSRVP
jgi:hypothetical protein